MILEEEKQLMEAAREFLCGYQLGMEMLNLRKYERKRAKAFDEGGECAELLNADETYWKARIYEVAGLLGSMKNSREKTVLYYRYVKGERMKSIARLIGSSRRTVFRLRDRGLVSVGELLHKRERGTASCLSQISRTMLASK